ncbi:MAG: helix-turn-helix domain-containing protein [Pseudomonadota bacterium]
MTTDDLMSVQQAADALGKQKMTIYRWLEGKGGHIVGISLAGTMYIPVSEVERLNKEAQKPPDELTDDRASKIIQAYEKRLKDLKANQADKPII